MSATAHMLSGLLLSPSLGTGPSPFVLPFSGACLLRKSFVKKVPIPIEQPIPAFFAARDSSTAFSMYNPSEKTILSAITIVCAES